VKPGKTCFAWSFSNVVTGEKKWGKLSIPAYSRSRGKGKGGTITIRTLRGRGDQNILDLLRKVDPEEIVDMRHERYGEGHDPTRQSPFWRQVNVDSDVSWTTIDETFTFVTRVVCLAITT
jgi:hypothetical protein